MSKKELQVRFIACTPQQREKGLMFENPLKENEAVYFIFPHNDRFAFWNKNVSFPLSLAFLDENGKVTGFADMDANSEKVVVSDVESRFVVEASQNTFRKMGVNEGDFIIYKDNKLQVCQETACSGSKH